MGHFARHQQHQAAGLESCVPKGKTYKKQLRRHGVDTSISLRIGYWAPTVDKEMLSNPLS